jgi:hypothetical protein
MMAFLRCLSAVWLVAGTLLFRDLELRVFSIPMGVLMVTLEALPSSVGLAWPAWQLFGDHRSVAFGMALRWAVAASWMGLLLPLVFSAVPMTTEAIGFRLVQGVALYLLLVE